MSEVPLYLPTPARPNVRGRGFRDRFEKLMVMIVNVHVVGAVKSKGVEMRCKVVSAAARDDL